MNAINEQEQEAVRQAKLDVKSEVAKQLIEAMESGNTPWQKPWKTQALMPINGSTQNGYRGINRILLALQNRSSNVWLTFKQAGDKGYRVRKGERGTPIVKVVEVEPWAKGEGAVQAESAQAGAGGQGDGKESRKAFILKRYFVFNAEQIEGYPIPQAEPEPTSGLESIEKAQAVVDAMREQTGLMVIHGGDKACYVESFNQLSQCSR